LKQLKNSLTRRDILVIVLLQKIDCIQSTTKAMVKILMKIRLVIFVPLVFFSCISYGDERFDLDTPEGWAMAFMTTSAQNLGLMPPRSVNTRDLSISAELSSIPHLTKEQQVVDIGVTKTEDLNKTPVFGRLRVSVGFPWDISAEISWTPPVKINDSKPDHLWGAALSKPLFSNEKIGLGLRFFLLRGGVIASVTCSEDVINFPVYTSNENPVGCVGLSKDRLKMNHEGVEVFLSFKNSSEIHPWISLASSNLDSSVKIDAPLQAGRERSAIQSSGSTHTFSLGFSYEFRKNWDLNISSSYTPLDVNRPNDSSGNDDFWNLKAGLTIRF
jgi:hypothetical protein